MTDITVYTKPTCPFCLKARALLSELGQTYENIDIAAEPERRDEMIEKAGGKTTVPQIFIDGRHVGGCDDLHALHDKGELEKLLA